MQSKLPVMPCKFTDRENELSALDNAYKDRPGLLVVYGRRRIGKTRLLVEWLKRNQRGVVYYVSHLSSHMENLRGLADRASRQLGDPLLSSVTFENMGSLLSVIYRSGGEVVVLDEFTYWVRGSPRVLSELQEYVDNVLPGTNMLLVLTGSLLGVMERDVLGGGSPLYARASHVLRLRELSFECLKELVQSLTPVDRVRVYALVGGVPFYLCQLAGVRSFREAVEKLIVSPASILAEEKDLILREELRDPHAYNAILSALARGYTRPSSIAVVTGLDQSHVRKYLHTLEYLRIVERVVPLFMKKGWYRISDPVIRTWFTLVKPVLELLELEKRKEALNEILRRIDTYTSSVWEQVLMKHLLKKHAAEGYTKSGPLVHKGEEIDIALVNPEEKKVIVGEAKWSRLTLREAEKIRRATEAKAARLVPEGYMVENVYVGAREVSDTARTPQWILTPRTIESDSTCNVSRG